MEAIVFILILAGGVWSASVLNSGKRIGNGQIFAAMIALVIGNWIVHHEERETISIGGRNCCMMVESHVLFIDAGRLPVATATQKTQSGLSETVKSE